MSQQPRWSRRSETSRPGDQASGATTPHSSDLEKLCSLDDPTRRRLYEYVVARAEPVTRDQASAALAIDRSTVAYHLDRLVEDGLLTATFARPEGRGGPGAGRPAKRYERAEGEFTVSVPPRAYRLAADLLASAIEADTAGTARQALHQAAARLGRALAANGEGRPEADFLQHLRRNGFEPYDDATVTRLRNCPFEHLARGHTELICGMNLALLTGLSEALGADVQPRLDPAPGRCCVAFLPG